MHHKPIPTILALLADLALSACSDAGASHSCEPLKLSTSHQAGTTTTTFGAVCRRVQ